MIVFASQCYDRTVYSVVYPSVGVLSTWLNVCCWKHRNSSFFNAKDLSEIPVASPLMEDPNAGGLDKNSSGDEIANVLVNDDIAHT